MKITKTNIDLNDTSLALQFISREKVKAITQDEINLAYKIKKNIRCIQKALRKYSFTIDKLIDGLAKKDEKDNIIRTSSGNIEFSSQKNKEKFWERRDEEDEREVEFDIYGLFTKDQVELLSSDYDVSLEVLGNISWLFEE